MENHQSWIQFNSCVLQLRTARSQVKQAFVMSVLVGSVQYLISCIVNVDSLTLGSFDPSTL